MCVQPTIPNCIPNPYEISSSLSAGMTAYFQQPGSSGDGDEGGVKAGRSHARMAHPRTMNLLLSPCITHPLCHLHHHLCMDVRCMNEVSLLLAVYAACARWAFAFFSSELLCVHSAYIQHISHATCLHTILSFQQHSVQALLANHATTCVLPCMCRLQCVGLAWLVVAPQHRTACIVCRSCC